MVDVQADHRARHAPLPRCGQAELRDHRLLRRDRAVRGSGVRRAAGVRRRRGDRRARARSSTPVEVDEPEPEYSETATSSTRSELEDTGAAQVLRRRSDVWVTAEGFYLPDPETGKLQARRLRRLRRPATSGASSRARPTCASDGAAGTDGQTDRGALRRAGHLVRRACGAARHHRGRPARSARLRRLERARPSAP